MYIYIVTPTNGPTLKIKKCNPLGNTHHSKDSPTTLRLTSFRVIGGGDLI